MRAVRDSDMPVDEALLYREIDPDTRAALLDYGAAFEEAVDAARAWDQEHAKATMITPPAVNGDNRTEEWRKGVHGRLYPSTSVCFNLAPILGPTLGPHVSPLRLIQ